MKREQQRGGTRVSRDSLLFQDTLSATDGPIRFIRKLKVHDRTQENIHYRSRKMKCAPYLAKHAFKYGMSAGKLVDLWLQADRPSEQGFVESLGREFDEETILWALPFITDLFRRVRAVQKREEALRQEVERCRTLSRKDFAPRMQRQLSPRDFAVAMLLWGGKRIGDQLLRQLLEDQIAATEVSASAAKEE